MMRPTMHSWCCWAPKQFRHEGLAASATELQPRNQSALIVYASTEFSQVWRRQASIAQATAGISLTRSERTNSELNAWGMQLATNLSRHSLRRGPY
eukprot:scaffold391451_cov52-Prasinocladus_malaysianus.AAC.1